MVKRVFDCVVAGGCLVLLSPVFLSLALLVKSASSGPVLRLRNDYSYMAVHIRAGRYADRREPRKAQRRVARQGIARTLDLEKGRLVLG